MSRRFHVAGKRGTLPDFAQDPEVGILKGGLACSISSENLVQEL